MKLTSLLAYILTMLPTTFAASDYQNSLACAVKNPSTNAAISKFCNKKGPNGGYIDDITVPGSRSAQGIVVDGIRIRLTGDCTPKQWVPQQYCLTQLHEMCALAPSKKGYYKRRYGMGGCQVWSIEAA
ncbi:hypothetical protein DOTSEDRAFT_75112 [Dothistroma septosporum NZE10]|uniref:Uncharacterized protein n=1 Tax=Dothistroma septosporum (strain NZE10 / CBS 128990) TaxID=675120 RepID=M2YJZ9_DOTSN|nr:hypothetical protein DOTSEDRAFT_75112 [Dothistroma septosporum NZE10]